MLFAWFTMSRIPEKERLKIIELCCKNYTQKSVAEMTGRSVKAVNRILQAYKKEGRVKDAPRGRPPRATTDDEDLSIVAAAVDAPRASLQELRQSLQLRASRSTVRRRLNEAGLRSRAAAQKPLLRATNKAKRLDFAQLHESWTVEQWQNAVFSDECTFTTTGDQRERVWRPAGTR